MQMMHLWTWIKASSIGDNTAGGVTGYIKAILANKHSAWPDDTMRLWVLGAFDFGNLKFVKFDGTVWLRLTMSYSQ